MSRASNAASIDAVNGHSSDADGSGVRTWSRRNGALPVAEEQLHLLNRRHARRFHFVYTPKHASWGNGRDLVSLLSRRVLRHASFRSRRELENAVRAFSASGTARRTRSVDVPRRLRAASATLGA
jgi:hypothetical protein